LLTFEEQELQSDLIQLLGLRYEDDQLNAQIHSHPLSKNKDDRA
jgi:hypothetical protein